MLVCFASIVDQLLDQRPSFLAVVRYISVLNESLPHFPLFHCQRMCEFVSCLDGVCGEGVLFVQLDVFIVLLCQVCGESRDIGISASPWNVLSGCRMNNLHKAIVVFRGWIDVTNMRVSKSAEKEFQLAFLKLKRRRKGVDVGVTAGLIRMAIGLCWVCGIGSSTALLLSEPMLLLTVPVMIQYA